MVPPTIFVSGGVAVLQLCKEIYVRFRNVKRFRRDCAKLAHFVHRIESFIAATEDDCDMTEPGWQEAFSALHEALLEVVHVFEKCANFGMLRSMINADELNLKLNSISQRLMLALQLIPIQKAKATDKRLAELAAIQCEIRSATFAAVAAAEEQSAALKRLMDQCTVDASKTQEMLQQVLLLLQADQPARVRLPAGACTGPAADGDGDGDSRAQQQRLHIDLAQLEAEVEDLQAEQQCALRDKDVVEQQYLEQIIAVITAMESQLQQQQPDDTATPTTSPAEVPVDLRCPITYQLLRDPVILADSGQTYERAAIEEWLSRGNMRDPITGARLSSNVLVANVLVRKLAQEWLETHPSYKEDAAVEPTAGTHGGTGVSSTGVSCFQQQQHKQQGSLEGEEDEDGYCVWEDGLDVDPKTAAILAASTSAGLSTEALKPGAGAAAGNFPALFAGSSASSNNMQGQFAGDGDDDKEAAQRAYARAVAAAAAAEAQTFVVAPAFMQAAGAGPPAAAGQGGDGTGSNNSSRCSSITFARATSSRSLPSITERRAPSTELRLHSVPSQPHSSTQLGMWPSVSLAQPASSIPEHQQQPQSLAAAPGSSNHASATAAAGAAPAEHAPAPVKGTGEDVARRLGLTGSESRRLSTSSSRQERTAAAQAAAAAIAQGQHGPFNLEKLHRTLGHAAEVSYRLAARDSSAAAAQEMKVQQQQMQQERDQQRNRAFLQQHVDTVLRSQSPLRQRQLSISPSSGEAHLQQQGGLSSSNRGLQSSVSMCVVPPSQQQHAPRGGASSSSQHQPGAGAPAAALRHCQSVPSAAIQGGAASYSTLQHSASRSSPSVPPSVRSVASSTRSAASAAEPSAAPLAPRRGLSGFMMGRSGRSSRASDVDAASVADRDEIASVSSTGSGDSRRSVGKSMMGVLNKIKYSMVYEDDKC